MKRFSPLRVAALGLVFASPALAQEVIITATRIPTTASSVIPSVTVYGRTEIESSGALSLADLIARQPGVEMGRNGGQGAVTSFFLRGAESKNVLVLVDGQRMRDGVTQSSLAENIPLELVERVEVIRGNVSALYGDGAVGGAILITTRSSPSGSGHKTVQAGIGTESSRTLGLSLGAPIGSVQAQLGLSHVATHGSSATDPSKTFSTDPSDRDRDPYERTAAQIGLGAPLLGGRIQWTQQSTWAHVRFDNDWMGLDPRQASTASLSGLVWSGPLAGSWTQELSVQQARHSLRTSSGADQQTRTQQTGWRVNGPFASGRLLAGLEHRRDTRSPSDGETGERTTPSQFVTWMLDTTATAVTAQLALRRDAPEDLRSRNTYLLGLGWRLSSTTRVTSTVSTAFRVPDGYALSTNPALQPEDTRSTDLGLSWQQSSGESLRLVAFTGRTLNPIVYDEAYTARNLAEIKNRGIELEAILPLTGPWQLRLGMTAQDPKSPLAVYGAVVQPTVWVQSARRAKWFGDVQLEGRWQGTDLRLRLSGAGQRRNTDSDLLDAAPLGGYALISVQLQRPVRPGLSAQLTVDNLTDQSYSLATGYPGEGRRAMVSLRWRG